MATLTRRKKLSRKGVDYWTVREDNYLKKHYHSKTYHEIGRHLGRTERACIQRALKLKLTSKYRKWTDKHVAFIKRHYRIHGARFVADYFGVPVENLRVVAHRYGVNTEGE